MTLEASVRLRLGALDMDVSLQVDEGEVVAVLGPNGAGKTTLLRALAGLLPLSAGRVLLDGAVLEDPTRAIRIPPERRPIGVVFQDYLLFPHLSALENVAFGLRCRGVSPPGARAQARDWLERMGLAEHVQARPAQLSGGQAQRIALARALAVKPRLLLLDEPLSALDATSKTEVRRDLRRHLASFKGIRLLVTHDPLEAAVLSDRLVVIERGRVVQTGSAAEVTQKPRSRYVADLVGVNLFRGHAVGDRVELAEGSSVTVGDRLDGEVFAVIHPRAVAVYRSRPDGTPRNVFPGMADTVDVHADRARVHVSGPLPLVAEVTPGAVEALRLTEGGAVWISVKATEVSVYPV